MSIESSAIVQNLTEGIRFEPGMTATDLTFVESLGFMATKEGGHEVRGMEVVGFMASQNGRYNWDGGYPEQPRPGVPADLNRKTYSFDELAELHLRRPHGLQIVHLTMGNHRDALTRWSTDAENNTVELWGALVLPRVPILNAGDGRQVVAVTDRELGRRKPFGASIRRHWADMGRMSIGPTNGSWESQEIEGETLEFAAAYLTFHPSYLASERSPRRPLTHIPLRKLGTLTA